MKKETMKKVTKSALAFALALVLAAANLGGTADAASVVYGSIDNTSTRGEITYDSTSATATTHFYHTGGRLEATATVYYRFGLDSYCSVASGVANMGAAVATASRKLYGSEVCGGKGKHVVTLGSVYSWTPPETTIGEILPDAKLLS